MFYSGGERFSGGASCDRLTKLYNDNTLLLLDRSLLNRRCVIITLSSTMPRNYFTSQSQKPFLPPTDKHPNIVFFFRLHSSPPLSFRASKSLLLTVRFAALVLSVRRLPPGSILPASRVLWIVFQSLKVTGSIELLLSASRKSPSAVATAEMPVPITVRLHRAAFNGTNATAHYTT